MPPGLDPVVLYVLYTYTQIPGESAAACRTYVDSSTEKLKAFADQLEANKSDGRTVTTMILPAEGLPA